MSLPVPVGESKGKPCKIWNSSRTVRKSCVAANVDSLKLEGKRKLEIPLEVPVYLVLEEDGTEVEDQDYFFLLPDFSTFILLKEQETWMPRSQICDSTSRKMCCDKDSMRSSSGDDTSEHAADQVDSVTMPDSPPKPKAAQLLDQLCSGNVYKQLLPWLLLRPTDLEEIVNANPEQLAQNHPRDTVDAIQEMSHKALTEYNNAHKAIQMLSIYDQAVNHCKNSK